MNEMQHVFAHARSLTEKHGLSQSCFARDATGEMTHYSRVDAVCFCAAGFLKRAALDLNANYHPAMLKLAAHLKQPDSIAVLPADHIALWNDVPERTIEDVRRMFESMILA